MSVTLLTTGIWRTLTAAARQSRGLSAAAVAYFGQGAAKLLPLQPGSRLVVDASEGAVKSGQTCPAELGKLVSRGVRVYTMQNLHAKVFVFGTKGFIGSANVSGRSAGTLVEAMLATTDRKAVRASRDFVRSLCVQELGPEAIKRLAKIYRPPRITGVRRPRPRATKQHEVVELPRVLLAQLRPADPPEGSESVQEAGRKVAAKRRQKPKRHKLDDFFWFGNKCPYCPGDMVVQVLKEGGGRRMISPPGTVVHTRAWRRGSRTTTFVFVEIPVRRRRVLEALAKRMGYGADKRLKKGGRLTRDFAERLLDAWAE